MTPTQTRAMRPLEALVACCVGLAAVGGCGSMAAEPQAPHPDAGATRDSASARHDAARVTETGAPDRPTPFEPTTTRSALTANNTSASSWFRDEYTPASRFNGSSTPVTNGDAPTSPTPTSDLSTGIVSKLPIRSLLYPGATTSIFVETQGWFCTNGVTPLPTGLSVDQCGSHVDNGYATNFTAHAQLQVADMMSRGIDGAIMDWSGQSAGMGVVDMKSTSTAAINTGAMFLFVAAAEASKGKFRVAVLEDEGIKTCAATSGCDVTGQLLSDIAFLNKNFFSSPAYLTSGGRPVLFFFSVDAWAKPYGKTIDWTTVRSTAAGNPLFLFENAGGFAHAESDGAYSWVSPTAYASYPGSDPYGTSAFLPYYYDQANKSPKLATWGSAYKGFDDNIVNGWGGGRRYAGQQCGKTWLETFDVVAKYYSASQPLDGIQLITWDDYEEGTELETGIDNHVAIATAVAGDRLTWTVTLDASAPAECNAADAGGSDPSSTIDHFTVYASPSSDGERLAPVADGLAPSTRSIDLRGKLPSGSWDLFVYATGKPSILNHLSAPVTTRR
jgi:hypothetical protein